MPINGSKRIIAIHITLRMTLELPSKTLMIAQMSKSKMTVPTRLIVVGITTQGPHVTGWGEPHCPMVTAVPGAPG